VIDDSAARSNTFSKLRKSSHPTLAIPITTRALDASSRPPTRRDAYAEEACERAAQFIADAFDIDVFDLLEAASRW